MPRARRMPWISLLLILLAMATPWSPARAADQPRPLRIAITDDYPPFTVLGPDGEAFGLLVDIWRLWSETTGRPIEFLPNSWAGTIDAVRTGHADIHSGLYRNREREQFLDFSDPIHENRSALHFRTGTKARPLDGLGGVAVGVVRKTHHDTFLETQHPTVNRLVFDDNTTMVRALLAGSVGAILTETVSLRSALGRLGLAGVAHRGPEILFSNLVHAGVAKGDPALLDAINAGLRALPRSRLIEIEQRWLPDPLDRYHADEVPAQAVKAEDPPAPLAKPAAPARPGASNTADLLPLTIEERNWLKEHPSIDIAMMDAWPPISYVDHQGTAKGVSGSLVEALNRKLDGALALVPGPWKSNYAAVEERRLPALFDITPRPDREKSFNFTTPYLTIPHVYVARRDFPAISAAADLNGRVLALEKGFGNVKWFRENHPEIQVREYADTSAALGAVARGEAEAYAGNQAVAMFVIERELLGNLRVHGQVDKPATELAIGVRKDWPILRDILQKALDAMTETERRAVLRSALFESEAASAGRGLGLSAAEKAWIAAHPTLRVRSASGMPPFNFTDGAMAQGYSVDLLNLIARMLGLRVDYVATRNPGEAIDMLRDRRLDIALDMVRTRALGEEFLFTQPYASTPMVVVARTDSQIDSFADLTGQKVCVPVGMPHGDLLASRYPGIAAVSAADHGECLQAVSRGKANATIGGLAIETHLIARLFLTNLKIASAVDDDAFGGDLRIAVRGDMDVLRDILDKAIVALSDDDLRPLRERWMGGEQMNAPSVEQRTDLRKVVIVIGGVSTALILLFTLMRWVIRRLASKDASNVYQSKEVKGTALALVGIFLTVVVLSAWLTAIKAERDRRAEVGGSLQAVLNIARAAVRNWVAEETLLVETMARDPQLARRIAILATLPRTPEGLRQSLELDGVQTWLAPHFAQLGRRGYFVIARDKVTLAARDESEIGRTNPIAERQGKLLDSAFKGDGTFVPPTFYRPADAKPGSPAPETPALFFAAPVRAESGEVLALLVIQDDPRDDLSGLMHSGRVGQSGESFVVDSQGRLVTTSRFEPDLRTIGLIGETANASLGLAIRDPGGDLTAGHPLPAALESLPPTVLAGDVMAGHSGTNVAGYRDYRGVRVLGAWAWDPDLMLGIASEIDEAEALASFSTIRVTMFIVLGLTVLTALGLTGLSVWIGQSSTRSLTRSRDTAERARQTAEEARLVAEEARSEAEEAEERLRIKVEEVERFNRLAVGRELRMGELKQRINDLLRELGREAPFARNDAEPDAGADAPAPAKDVDPKAISAQFRRIIATHDLEPLFSGFAALVGVPIAIIDLDAVVLASSRWQRACTDFHRVNETTCARCIESDTDLALKLQEGQRFSMYRCRNGMTDCASPIVVEGVHVANAFIGQFHVSAPDEAFFRARAIEVGFDPDAYLAAVQEAPVVDEDRLPHILDFLTRFAHLIASFAVEAIRSQEGAAELGDERAAAMNLAEDTELARAELAAYKDHLEDLVEERTRELRESEAKTRLLLESVGDGIFGTDRDGRVIFANTRASELLGYAAGELIGQTVHQMIHHSHADGTDYPIETCPMWRAYSEGASSRVDDEVLWRKDGTPFPVEYSATPIEHEGAVLGSVVAFRDVTARKEAERHLAEAYAVISDSIQYAASIQRAVLTGDSLLAAIMTDHFIHWEPRDLVGGDIYWCHTWGDGLLVMLADCTGHGVPGAFMTLIATGALDRAMTEVPPGSVGMLIQRMHQIIQTTLGQHGDQGTGDDGLELGACYIAPDLSHVTFAGARTPLFVVEDGNVTEIRGSKGGIGYRGIPHDQSFEEQCILLSSGRSFFLTTDGLPDQIGGERRRMFGKKRFATLLTENHHLPMAEQKALILQALAEYQGDEIRRDDVSIIGFRI